jgi:hypothetical protein
MSDVFDPLSYLYGDDEEMPDESSSGGREFSDQDVLTAGRGLTDRELLGQEQGDGEPYRPPLGEHDSTDRFQRPTKDKYGEDWARRVQEARDISQHATRKRNPHPAYSPRGPGSNVYRGDMEPWRPEEKSNPHEAPAGGREEYVPGKAWDKALHTEAPVPGPAGGKSYLKHSMDRLNSTVQGRKAIERMYQAQDAGLDRTRMQGLLEAAVAEQDKRDGLFNDDALVADMNSDDPAVSAAAMKAFMKMSEE